MNISPNTTVKQLQDSGLRLRFVRRSIKHLHKMPNKNQCHIKQLQKLVNEYAILTSDQRVQNDR
jgi:hypothetical protein